MTPIPMTLMISSIVAATVYGCFVAFGLTPFRLSALLFNVVACCGVNVPLVIYRERRKAIAASANKPLPRSGYDIGLYD